MSEDVVQDIKETVSILVVDDDAMVRSVLIEYLMFFGFRRITDMSGGRAALKVLNDPQEKFDLVLADWQMPDVDGLALLRLTRNLAFRKETRFIMITSQVPEERIKIAKARLAGVDAYIVKPFNGQVLREKIWGALGWKNDGGQTKTG